MGPYSPISPAASPETATGAAETGDGLTIAVEGSILPSLLYVGLVSSRGWDPNRLIVSFTSEATADSETTVDQNDSKNPITADTNVDLTPGDSNDSKLRADSLLF